MRRYFISSFLIIGLLGSSCLSHAEQTTGAPQLAGLIREPLTLTVTLPNGQHAALDAYVTRPDTPGVFPIALITHGTDGTEQSDRQQLTPNRFSAAAITFARHGYAAVVVMRQGYGQSTGHNDYQGNSCAHPQHALAGKMAREDLLAALVAIREQPWAAQHQAVLVGQSSGGFSVLAASALNPPGVQAIISFSGGRGAMGEDQVCDKTSLLAALKSYGQTAHIPTLWLYSANDQSFSPQLGKEMFKAYRHADAKGKLVTLPAFGDDGHDLLISAPEEFWWRSVSSFLSQQYLPNHEVVSISKVVLAAPAGLTTSGQQAFKHYLSDRGYEKAFASNGEGVWGSAHWARTQQDANHEALAYCEQYREKGEAACTVYAAGDQRSAAK
ncbi:CocE/NonD family hydrolase [Erwinia sp. S59]|uniref:dienelactone hydrolase family protein n=1 Tax=Erwinia sp. S59 TaxID=2769340 RepID=UPI00336BE0AB